MKPAETKQAHPVRSVSPGAWLVFLFAAAALVRVAWLGRAAFRADTLHFFQWAQQGLSFGQILGQWTTLMRDTAQFPLPAAFAVGLADILPGAATAFSVRLSDALFGALAAVFGALAARELGGRRFMVFAAVLWVVSPFHLQVSREAYFYSTLVAGAAMLFWAVVACARRLEDASRLPLRVWVGMGIGVWLCAYSHFTGWIMAAWSCLLIAGMAWRRGRSLPAAKPELAPAVLIPAGLAVPLLFLPWAVPYFLRDLGNPDAKAESIRVMGEVTEPMISILWRYALTMGWGTWSLGIAVTVLGLAGIAFAAASRRTAPLVVSLILLGVSLVSYILIMKARGIYVAVRHISFLFPVYITLVSFGLWTVAEWIRGTGDAKPRRLASLVLPAVAVLLLIGPAWQVLRLTGYPTPYRDIKAWFDTSLPSGTPVLVDRWFEPWNELTIYPTTNVVFTFTAPNEPLDVFLSSRWRDQAQAFLQNNPDAAYFEVAKSYWDEPEVGAWSWPREYFARHHAIANTPGLILRDLGLAFREDFYPANSNRVVVEVFYNTREDVLERLRAAGVAVTALNGPGLRYEKSGPMGIFRFQTPQFMDWRVLEKSGTLDLVNLTDQPVEVSVRIAAVCPRGSKVVRSGNRQPFRFSGPQMQRWTLGPIRLEPGTTPLVLDDPQWERELNPLLIASVDVLPAEPEPEP